MASAPPATIALGKRARVDLSVEFPVILAPAAGTYLAFAGSVADEEIER